MQPVLPNKSQPTVSPHNRKDCLLVSINGFLSVLLPKTENILKGHDLLHHFCLSWVMLLCALDLPWDCSSNQAFRSFSPSKPLTLGRQPSTQTQRHLKGNSVTVLHVNELHISACTRYSFPQTRKLSGG